MNEPATVPLGPAPVLPAVLDTYKLRARLGGGGSGEVWLADAPDSREVAIKWLRCASTVELHHARQEVAALRWLNLPGVVQFLEEGQTDLSYWVVMEYVAGQPFPGHHRLGWEQLRPRALRLLTILERVHRAGVIHRDLKPSNIQVKSNGDVVLIDFGISIGRVLSRSTEIIAGTPGYIAPECLTGTPASIASDLYAVGVIIQNALAASAPTPTSVKDALAQLTHPDPAQRPQSATEAALLLGDPPRSFQLCADWRSLFAGPEHYLHLPTMGAEYLSRAVEQTLEHPSRVLAMWEQQGIGYWEDERFVLNRLALIDWGDPDASAFAGRLLSGQDRAQVRAEAIARIQQHLDMGQAERALKLAERLIGLGDTTSEIVILAAIAATRLESAAAFSRAICLLRRCPDTPQLQDIDRLLQASECVLRGAYPEARRLVESIMISLPEPLEIWRQGTWLQGHIAHPYEATAIAAAQAWAHTPERMARWEGWAGHFYYRQGDYIRAATLHQSSAEGRQTLDSRLSALRAAAVARMEIPDLAGARALAAEVRQGAYVIGDPVQECRAEWVERTAAWRMDQPFLPDPARVAAAKMVRPLFGALLALTDAAVAWHHGDKESGALFSQEAASLFRAERRPIEAALADSLRFACQGGTRAEADRIAHMLDGGLTDITLQGLALLSSHVGPYWSKKADLLLQARPYEQWQQRLDILSFADCKKFCCHL